MLKSILVLAGTALLALATFSNPAPTTAGSWQIDTRHSDAQLVTDASADNGKTKVDATVGFARIAGKVSLDDSDLGKSRLDFAMYPATSTSAPIDEDGKFLNQWLTNLSNQTLVCFHSKGVSRRPDGRLQATGDLVLTRIDRNVEAAASEAYSGPVYGPPIFHRVSHEATLVFDVRRPDAKSQKDGGIVLSGSTRVHQEDFPQLVKAVLTTYWPNLVQDQKCQTPVTVGESFNGTKCTGTVLMAPLAATPPANIGEGYAGLENVHPFIGDHLNILVHMHLTEKTSGERAAAGN